MYIYEAIYYSHQDECIILNNGVNA